MGGEFKNTGFTVAGHHQIFNIQLAGVFNFAFCVQHIGVFMGLPNAVFDI